MRGFYLLSASFGSRDESRGKSRHSDGQLEMRPGSRALRWARALRQAAAALCSPGTAQAHTTARPRSLPTATHVSAACTQRPDLSFNPTSTSRSKIVFFFFLLFFSLSHGWMTNAGEQNKPFCKRPPKQDNSSAVPKLWLTCSVQISAKSWQHLPVGAPAFTCAGLVKAVRRDEAAQSPKLWQ